MISKILNKCKFFHKQISPKIVKNMKSMIMKSQMKMTNSKYYMMKILTEGRLEVHSIEKYHKNKVISKIRKS